MNREKSFSEAEKTTRLNIWDIELNLRKSNVPWRILRASAEPAVFLMRKIKTVWLLYGRNGEKRTASSDEQQFTALYGAGGFEKVEQMPLTKNGKTDRRALMEKHAKGARS